MRGIACIKFKGVTPYLIALNLQIAQVFYNEWAFLLIFSINNPNFRHNAK